MCLGTLIAYSMCSLGILILRYCPAPEKLIGIAQIPETSEYAEMDEEKAELERKLAGDNGVSLFKSNISLCIY